MDGWMIGVGHKRGSPACLIALASPLPVQRERALVDLGGWLFVQPLLDGGASHVHGE